MSTLHEYMGNATHMQHIYQTAYVFLEDAVNQAYHGHMSLQQLHDEWERIQRCKAHHIERLNNTPARRTEDRRAVEGNTR